MGIGHLLVEHVFQFAQEGLQHVYPVGEKQRPHSQHQQLWAVLQSVGGQGIQPAQHRKMKTAVDQVVAVFSQYLCEPGPVLMLDNLGNAFLNVAMDQ